MLGKARHIHFIGIGGIGMSGIAEVLLNLEFEVSGSDLDDTAITRNLASLGARIFKGHSSENVEGADVVVISSAIGKSNPEIKAAETAGLPIIPRSYLYAISPSAISRELPTFRATRTVG